MGSIYTTRLEGLVRSTRIASDPEAKIVLSRLHNEIKHRLANGSPAVDFFLEVTHSLTSIKGTAHSDIRMQCLFDSAHFFYLNGQGAEALRALHYADELASRSASKQWERKVSNMMGAVFADLGNVAEAVPRQFKAFDLARELADPIGQMAALINLGIALNYVGLYREAIPCFRQAVSIGSSTSDLQEYCTSALTNLAQSHLYLEEYEVGFGIIGQVLARSREPNDSVSADARAIREFTFVQFALELGKLELARQHASICLGYGRSSGTMRSKFNAELSLALCEIHGGDVASGIESLEKVLECCGETAVREDALVALVKAYDCAGQPERALAHLDALISHVRAGREKGIAALLLTSSFAGAGSIASEQSDLRALNLREAKLKAKVAEREVVRSQIEMLERFAMTAGLREDASGEHGYRVGKLAALLSAELGWDRAATYALELGARLHDIGKVGVPDRILLNSKQLRDVERHFICAHTAIGAELLARSRFPHVQVAEEIARHHHEWWNGEGYPSKLAGKRIPIHARIVAIADVFDAMTHGRPFAEPWPIDRALEEIATRRGTQFDPELIDTFLKLIEKLRAEHRDLDAYLGKAGSDSPFAQARNRIRLMLSAERENERKVTAAEAETLQ